MARFKNYFNFFSIFSSQVERANGAQLGIKADALVNECAMMVWDSWSATNNAINKRAVEQVEAKNKILHHLEKVSLVILNRIPLSLAKLVLGLILSLS